MSKNKSKFSQSLRSAIKSSIVVVATVLAAIFVRFLVVGFFDGNWHANWIGTIDTVTIVGLLWFVFCFILIYLMLHRNRPAEAILDQMPPPATRHDTLLTGFVAMEHYGLILNRTYVVFVAPEGLYGWKATGVVTGSEALYFLPYAEMLHDPELMRDRGAIKKLSELKGGFFIPRSAIASSEIINKQKWGMGFIPHSGRIRVGQTSGQSREFILLGSVDPVPIQESILPGAMQNLPVLNSQQVKLPYIARTQKKLWMPLLLLWSAISIYTLWDFKENWTTSNWPLRIALLVMIAAPLLILPGMLVPKICFTESAIARTNWLGRVETYPYSSISRISSASDSFLVIHFVDKSKLRIYTFLGNPRSILSILQAKASKAFV
jgi:hypothetical protein